jgi:hypothetical protein
VSAVQAAAAHPVDEQRDHAARMAVGGRISTGERNAMRDRIKVLFVAADPFREGARVELSERMRTIGHAVRQGPAGEALDIVAHFARGADELRAALLRHRPQVVHFAAPAGQPGVVCLADEDGRPCAAGAEVLRDLFGGRGSVRVVVLDGCDTLPIVQALGEVVDYTIGMAGPITDRSAILFAQAFYTALGMGRTVLAAFELGVSQLEMEGSPDAAMPMRRIRRGVDLDATLAPGPDARVAR